MNNDFCRVSYSALARLHKTETLQSVTIRKHTQSDGIRSLTKSADEGLQIANWQEGLQFAAC